MIVTIFIACLLVLAGLIVEAAILRKSDTLHKKNIRRAKGLHAEIQESRRSFEETIAYLRTVNPFVFEELVLEAFASHGWKIRRNRHYSGDGGVDGRVRKGRNRYLVQCKRYKGHIEPADVEAFAKTCQRRRRKGFFVHTGRTGEASRQIAAWSGRVTIISGEGLVNFLKH